MVKTKKRYPKSGVVLLCWILLRTSVFHIAADHPSCVFTALSNVLGNLVSWQMTHTVLSRKLQPRLLSSTSQLRRENKTKTYFELACESKSFMKFGTLC